MLDKLNQICYYILRAGIKPPAKKNENPAPFPHPHDHGTRHLRRYCNLRDHPDGAFRSR